MFFPIICFGQNLAALNESDFKCVNLNSKGLESVKESYDNKRYQEAATKLLSYYRTRTHIKHPDYNLEDKAKYYGKKLAASDQEKADKGMEHLFFVHGGYGYLDYGKDINWQFWPVKDNEIRFQVNRMYWWIPMGLAYWSGNDEKYAKEWVFQYLDWIKKNKLGLSAENDQFAWRPLEISDRLQAQTAMFNLFISSPNFTPEFLMAFLNNYSLHANQILKRYSKHGNHLLFEAQRMVYAGAFFPELNNAEEWKNTGIEKLNAEIKSQVYDDGLQFELSPNYHLEAINIFLKAINMAKLVNVADEFPPSYVNTVEKMIMALNNISYPSYAYPMFSAANLKAKSTMLKFYKEWSEAFPDNKVIRYYATNGKEGELPKHLSKALKTGGFYTFRNGWNDTSTVMSLKASPPAFFHSQPDNGTFELWVKGRNFMPDAGAYVYRGNEEIMKMRNWYRQTRVHQTLTLNNANIDSCNAKLLFWNTSENLDVLVYKNPSYTTLNHYRTVLFIDKKYFLILDKAEGSATGNVGIHFQLIENSNPEYNYTTNTVVTKFKDGNNLLVKNFNSKNARMLLEEGKVSYAYRKEVARPAFVFEQNKSSKNEVAFSTILYPFSSEKAPEISLKEGKSNSPENGIIDLVITINGVKRNIHINL